MKIHVVLVAIIAENNILKIVKLLKVTQSFVFKVPRDHRRKMFSEIRDVRFQTKTSC